MPDPYWEQIGEEAKKARALRDVARVPKVHGPIGKTGRRKYKCIGCGYSQYEHWIVRTRATRLRCPSCGSLSYEPYTREAKGDIADLNDVRKSYDGEKGTGKGKFVKG